MAERGEVNAFQSFSESDKFFREGYWRVCHGGGGANTIMPGADAPPQVNSWVSLRLYLPLLAAALVALVAILFLHGTAAATAQSNAWAKPVAGDGKLPDRVDI